MLKTIKVINTPAGEAPEIVRQQWVGSLLHASGPNDGGEVGVLADTPRPRRLGYRVEREHALEVLDNISPAAADWFRNNSLWSPYFVFGVDEVQEIHNEGS